MSPCCSLPAARSDRLEHSSTAALWMHRCRCGAHWFETLGRTLERGPAPSPEQYLSLHRYGVMPRESV
jgi:hypothetical protein